MLVDIFIEILAWVPAAGHTPKIEPVVPNLMSGSSGSRPASAGDAAAARAAVDITKWRRLSMAFSPLFLLVAASLSASAKARYWRGLDNELGKKRVIPLGVAPYSVPSGPSATPSPASVSGTKYFTCPVFALPI